MDPMEAAEAEILRKEEEELNDVREAIGLEDFLSKRDFSDRGRDVVTSGKQWQQVQTIAKALHLREYRNIQANAHKKFRGGLDDDAPPVAEFNLLDKRRVLLREGAANKREPDGKLWKTTRKYIFLFNDLILICSKRDRKSPDEYDLQEVIGMNELRVVNLAFDENEDPAALELAASRRGQRVREGTILSFSSEADKSEWMREIVSTSFAYHLSNKTFARQLGWQHEIVQGTAHSAAYLGDAALLRKVLRTMDRRGETIDIHDDAGMCPIHWAVLRGHEACVRILLDKGADIDVMNTGLNTPLLLAVCKGFDSIARLLLDKGADLFVRNLVDKDCVMMAVLFGHSSKGLPWVLQLLNSRGLDLNQFDANGATPLHMCASKNLPRPVRMLVDAGADVNCLHQRTQLTPLQMACSHARPDVETIRSFLDKGAYVNWRDLQGRTAFDIVLQSCRPAAVGGADGGAGPINAAGAAVSKSSDDPGIPRESFAMLAGAGGTQQKYANMDVTLTRVGDVAVYCLPVLLEIAKKGGRFAEADLDFLRRSFKEAIVEARTTWNQKREPSNFGDFVLAREQAGEELRTSKANWTDDGPVCQLCAGIFGIGLRRHHCRACGGLVCEACSSKRLLLSVINDERALQAFETLNSAPTVSSPLTPGAKERDANELYLESKRDRVCDGCFVRLCFEASQPSPDHFRVRQLKICADDLVKSLMSLVEALEDPDGSEGGGGAAGAGLATSRASLSRPVEAPSSPMKAISRLSLTRGASAQFSSPAKPPVVRSAGDYVRSNEALIEAIRVRDEKLVATEHLAKKFLEASDGYHRIAKKLIEEKMANSRLWGAAGSGAAATPGSAIGSP